MRIDRTATRRFLVLLLSQQESDPNGYSSGGSLINQRDSQGCLVTAANNIPVAATFTPAKKVGQETAMRVTSDSMRIPPKSLAREARQGAIKIDSASAPKSADE
jgi:hypothetical protein